MAILWTYIYSLTKTLPWIYISVDQKQKSYHEVPMNCTEMNEWIYFCSWMFYYSLPWNHIVITSCINWSWSSKAVNIIKWHTQDIQKTEYLLSKSHCTYKQAERCSPVWRSHFLNIFFVILHTSLALQIQIYCYKANHTTCVTLQKSKKLLFY
jgi:hypothetical protein